MVNQVILDYLTRYSGMYNFEDIKNKIISSGYSLQEFDEAARVLGLESAGVKKFFEFNDEENQMINSKKSFKWMKFAGIMGIIFLIMGILSSIVLIILPFFYTPTLSLATINIFSSFFSNPLTIVIGIALFLLFSLAYIFFYRGFYGIGKVCESKLLKFSSRVFIFLIILFLISIITFAVLFLVFGGSIINSLLNLHPSRGLSVGIATGSAINIAGVSLKTGGYIFVIGILSLVLIVFLNTILFFIGLIKIGNKVRFARIAGIFGLILFLISIGLSLFLISDTFLLITISSSGFIAFFIASIFSGFGCLILLLMILSLFDASRKFE